MKTAAGALGLVSLVLANLAAAEPYLAVNSGLKCIACHSNPSGGGKRNDFGNRYAWSLSDPATPGPDWDGRLSEHIGVGGDLRANLLHEAIPGADDELAFELEETLLYLELNLLPRRFSLYLDQRLAPGGANTRESWALYWLREQRLYVKAGQMFLPHGLRLEDDSAFVRAAPAINYTTPDTGVEIGLELPRWSMQLALSNGNAGGRESDRGKQLSAVATHVRPGWRAGASLNYNDTASGERTMVNLFAGLRTGALVWLAQLDAIADETGDDGRREPVATLLEANWVRGGSNLKLSLETLAPDSGASNDERRRISAVWESFAWPFTQLRAGVRDSDGLAADGRQNSTVLFVQLHNYF